MTTMRTIPQKEPREQGELGKTGRTTRPRRTMTATVMIRAIPREQEEP